MKKIEKIAIIIMIISFLTSCASYRPRPGKPVKLNTSNYEKENLEGNLTGAHVTFSKNVTLKKIPKTKLESRIGNDGEIILEFETDGENDLMMLQRDTVWKVYKEKRKKPFKDDRGEPILEETEMKTLAVSQASSTDIIYQQKSYGGLHVSVPYSFKNGKYRAVTVKETDSLRPKKFQVNGEGEIYQIHNGKTYFFVIDAKNKLQYLDPLYLEMPYFPQEIQTSLRTTKGDVVLDWVLVGGDWRIKYAGAGQRITTPHQIDRRYNMAFFNFNGKRHYIVIDGSGEEWALSESDIDLQLKSVRLIKDWNNKKGFDRSLSY